MRWAAMARLLALTAAVTGVAGCASSGDLPKDPERRKALAKVRTELAANYYQQAKYGVALEEIEKALRANSDYAPAYNLRGLVHMQLQEDGEAETDFQRAFQVDPADSETHNNYGWFLCQRGRERESIKHFLIAASDPLYETKAGAYLNAGICSRKAGKLDEAGTFLQRALILQPDFAQALAELADLAYANGDYNGAKSYFARFEKLQGVKPSSENLLLAVRIERKLGDRRGEAAYAARLKRDFPDSREAKVLGQIR